MPDKSGGPRAATPPRGQASPLAGTLAIAAEGNLAETTALQTVLRAEGMRVEIVAESRELLEMARRQTPQVVLLDASLSGLDLGRVTRILSRNPATAATAVVLVAPQEADGRMMRRLKEFDAFALLRRPLTCATIRETFRNAVIFSREAATLHQRTAGKGRPTKLVADCDALLRRELLCPFHSFGVPVDYYQLRVGRIYADADLFDLPVYKKATREGDFIDYHLAGLAICRECLFATNDPGYFEDPDQPRPIEEAVGRASYRIDDATRTKIRDTAGSRSLLVHDRFGGDPPASFFRFDRSPQEALVAYELAIASSQALYEAAPVRRNTELLRLGNYELRRTMLAPDDPAGHRRATQWLTQAVAECSGTALYKAAYQLVAIHVYLDDDATAYRYLATLKNLSQVSRREQEDPVSLDRYFRRAQNVWSERDRYRATPARG